jgi:RNA polymerase sigma factor (sigma-70 family)
MEPPRTDGELLMAYANLRSELAFAELVGRHVDWVYSAAARIVRDAHLAEDVTQAVFVLLARKARTFGADAAVGAWLFRTLRFVASDALRSKRRRTFHESKAGVQMIDEQRRRDARWEEVAPELEAAVAALGRTDRRAVLLRFYERKPYAQVAMALGVSEAAAQMRVSRALEALRTSLRRRGVLTASGGALATAMGDRAVAAAPARLASSSLTAAQAAFPYGVAGGGSALPAMVKGALWAMTMNTMKIAGVIALVALLAGGGAVAVFRRGGPPAVAPTPVAGGEAPVFDRAEDPSKWRETFDRAYALAPNQTVRFIKPPYISERMQFFLSFVGGGPNRIGTDMKTGPRSMYLEWDPQLHKVPTLGIFNDEYSPLSSVFYSLLDIEDYELLGPSKLLQMQLEGDWIVRAGTTREQRLAEVERVLREDCGVPIRIVHRRLPQPVIVVSGTLTAPGNVVQVYSDRMTGDKPGEGTPTRLDDFFQLLARSTRHRVVNETSAPADQKIRWTMHTSGRIDNMPPKRAEAKLNLILANISRQSGLQLRREMRTVDVWEVTADETSKATQ